MKWPKMLSGPVTLGGLLTAVIAGAAVVQAVSSIYQWRATEKQYRAMMKQLEVMQSDQQPWIAFHPPENRKLAAGETFRVAIALESIGKTPAIITAEGPQLFYARKGDRGLVVMQDSPEVTIDEKQLLANACAAAQRRPAHIILPPGDMHVGEVTELERLTEAKIKDIEDGTMVPVLFYFIDYSDTSGNEFSAWTCYVYAANLKQWIRNPTGHGIQQNCPDENTKAK